MLKLFDTTLRDGTQAEEITFTVDDKIHIAQMLDDFGIHYIEGGWPGSNPKDLDFFNKIKSINLNSAKITAFGSTRRAKNTCEQDSSTQALISSGAEVACIFGKSWDFHVTDALGISLEQNLEIITDTVQYLKRYFNEVIFDAEHLFDGFNSNPTYTINTLKAAEEGGASCITLCDTNGGAMPWQISEAIIKIKEHIGSPIGIHTHNDSETAVANALAAIHSGASLVQGTINGFGERCGNANLISIIAGAQLKLGKQCVPAKKLKKLTNLSRAVQEIANLREWHNQPYSGKSAFAHKGGIHVSAILKNPDTYEHIEPELIGNQRRVLISDLSGRSNIEYKVKELGITNKIEPNVLNKIVEEVKLKEHDGYSYEAADASLELIVNKHLGDNKDYFTLKGYRIIDEKREVDENSINEATVQVLIPNGDLRHVASLGDGPVDALNKALLSALSDSYPELNTIKLVDYKVRILNSHNGTQAITRVIIESANEHNHWSTVGVGKDILAASYSALVDSIKYHLLKSNVVIPNG